MYTKGIAKRNIRNKLEGIYCINVLSSFISNVIYAIMDSSD